ncbi:MAG: HAD family hydrolase [Anaerolineaceae bacterium]
MLELRFPGKPEIKISYVLCDINGTLSLDGQLLDGVVETISQLKKNLEVHLISANTTGTAAEIANQLGVRLQLIEGSHEAQQKERYLEKLGAEQTIAIGQGANDALMLKKAVIGICVLSREGSALKTMNAADMVVPDILAAFELLQKPLRIVATLRQ